RDLPPRVGRGAEMSVAMLLTPSAAVQDRAHSPPLEGGPKIAEWSEERFSGRGDHPSRSVTPPRICSGFAFANSALPQGEGWRRSNAGARSAMSGSIR